MKSIFLVLSANIRSNKSAHLLIGIMIFIASFLLCSSIGLLINLGPSFDNMLDSLNSGNITISFSADQSEPGKYKDWWDKQKEVISSIEYVHFRNEDNIFINGNKIEVPVYVMERPVLEDKNVIQDKLIMVESSFSKEDSPIEPDTGEIWISNILASSNDINLGDTVGIPTSRGQVNFIVTAFVIDPQFNSQLGMKRFWIKPGDFYLLESPLKYKNRMLSIRVGDVEKIDLLLNRFYEYSGGNIDGEIFTYQEMKNDYLMMFNIIGMVIAVIAFIALLISLFILAGNMTTFIRKEYRQIGILKALGYTTTKVKIVYFLQILILVLLFTLLGILTGTILSKALITSMALNAGLSIDHLNIIIPASATILIILVIVFSVTGFRIQQAGKIKPTEAIRFGYRIKQNKKRKIRSLKVRKGNSLSLFLSFRNMFQEREKWTYLLIPLILTVLITSISLHGTKLLKNSISNSQFWGIVDADITLYRSGGLVSDLNDSELRALLKNIDEIDTILAASPILIGQIPEETRPFEVTGYVYSNNMKELGLINQAGEHPERKDEISITDRLQKKYELSIGDLIELTLSGVTETYRITGIFQCTDNLGYSFRLNEAAYRRIKPNYQAAMYYARLKEKTASQLVIDNIERRFGSILDGVNKSVTINGIENDFKSMMPYMKILFLLLSLIFFIISFIIIQNNTAQYIQDNKKDFGIYKTLGFTHSQLRRTALYRTFMVLIFSMLIGIPLSIYLSPKLMNLVFYSSGFGKFQSEIDFLGLLISLPLFALFGYISTYGPSNQILKIDIRELVRE